MHIVKNYHYFRIYKFATLKPPRRAFQNVTDEEIDELSKPDKLSYSGDDPTEDATL